MVQNFSYFLSSLADFAAYASCAIAANKSAAGIAIKQLGDSPAGGAYSVFHGMLIYFSHNKYYDFEKWLNEKRHRGNKKPVS